MPNWWSFFCGGPEAVDGGDPATTWRREIQEEIGVLLDASQIAALSAYVDPRYAKPRHVFVGEWPDLSTAFVLGEGDGIDWFSLDEALGLPDLPDVAKQDLHRFARERGLALS
jgi:8-oxo-dGTP pyrophosphatase MutT (NUDIX family)